MYRIPNDFPDNIKFFYLLTKAWEIFIENYFKLSIISLFYIILSIATSLIPYVGSVFSHLLIFGFIAFINNHRIDEQYVVKELFWPFLSINNFLKSMALSIMSVPFFILTTILVINFKVFDELTILVLICFTIPFTLYLLFISILGTFITIIEEKDFIQSLKRSREILHGHFKDFLVIGTGIICFNILGTLSVIGIIFSAYMSIVIMLEFTRFLIREYELKSLS